MTSDDKLEFLAGQIHALIGFATAVITSHPNLSVLAHHVEKVAQINLAMAEGAAVSNEYVSGVQDMQDRLRTVVETALARRTPLDSS